MSNLIRLDRIENDGYEIRYFYSLHGYWKKYFKPKEQLFVRYSREVQASYEFLAIPFLCMVMPLAWMFHAKVYVEQIDQTFLNALEKYRIELKKLYPRLWTGESNIIAGKVRIDMQETGSDHAAVYFSGGVDAWGTLIQNIDKKPYILTVIGADIDIENNNAQEKVKADTKYVGGAFQLPIILIETNLRKAMDETLISRHTGLRCMYHSWKSIWAGIGIIGLSAPIAYSEGVGSIYLSTSYTDEEMEQGYRDAILSPLIEALEWGKTRVYACGKEESRQDKIESIVRFKKESGNKIKLRVCWKNQTGKNCCKCEKCYRTAMGIAATGERPEDYGFQLKPIDYIKIPKELSAAKKTGNFLDEDKTFWNEIKRNFKGSKWYWKWIKYYQL